jgi:hypothetical protein
MFLKQLDDVSLSASAIVDHIFSVTCGECCGGWVTASFDDQDGHNVSLISSALGHLGVVPKTQKQEPGRRLPDWLPSLRKMCCRTEQTVSVIKETPGIRLRHAHDRHGASAELV